MCGAHEATRGLLRSLLKHGVLTSLDCADPNAAIASKSTLEGNRCRSIPLAALPEASRRQGYDLIFGTFGDDTPSLVLRARYFPRASMVCLVHSMNYGSTLSGVGVALRWNLLRSYDAILCSTETARRTLAAMVGFWRDKERRGHRGGGRFPPLVRTVPFGVALPAGEPSKQEARSQLGLSPKDVVILSLGRLSLLDKADYLAMLVPVARLLRAWPRCNLRLIVAGEDSHGLSSVLRSVGRGLGLGKVLRVYPDATLAMRSRLFCAADIFLSLSDNIQETFGMTLIEAMAHRLPVVASDWGGYRDVVSHGKSGFLVPSLWGGAMDSLDALSSVDSMRTAFMLARRTVVDLEAAEKALRTLVEHPALRSAMGSKGRRLVRERYSWEVIAQQAGAVIRELRTTAQSSRAAARPLFDLPEGHDYSRVFGHYPSSVLGPETRLVTVSSDRLPWAQNPLLAILDPRATEGVEAIVRAVEDGCDRTERCIASVCRQLSLAEDEATGLLLLAAKYGVIGLRPARPRRAKERSARDGR